MTDDLFRGLRVRLGKRFINSVKLKKDVERLQFLLEDYVTKCKGNVKINVPKVQKLLEKYGSKTAITDQNKPLIKAVLQRHVIGKIIEYADEYFKKDKKIIAGRLGTCYLHIASINETEGNIIDAESKYNIEIDFDSAEKMITVRNCIDVIAEKMNA